MQNKWYQHDRMDWQTNSMPSPKELDQIDCKNIIRNHKGYS